MPKKVLYETSYLRGAFLTDYLFADVLFSQYCTASEMRVIYDEYASVFRIRDRKWLDTMWQIISSDLFALSDNRCDFERLVRLSKQFPDSITDDESFVILKKSRAVKLKSEIMPDGEEATSDDVVRRILQRADGCSTNCLSLIGFLAYHGFFMSRNREIAEADIATAASWNDLFSILMGAEYTDRPQFYHRKLAAVLRDHFYDETRRYFMEDMNIPDGIKPDLVASGLESMLCADIYDRGSIEPDIINIMHSKVLSKEAKHALIRSKHGSKDGFPNIPLNISGASDMSPLIDTFSDTSEMRRTEFDQIRSNLSMTALRATSSYKPLLLVCRDDLVLEFYLKKLRECFAGSPIVQISLNEGEGCDLSASNDNIFISAMNSTHDKNTVLIIDHCERLRPETAAELAKYLKAPNRRQHKSGGHTPVEIDLSGVLPILLASSTPDRSITEVCDIALAEDLSRPEFDRTVNDILEDKKRLFELGSLTMEPELYGLLFEYSPDAVMQLLNKAIVMLRGNGRDVCLTVSAVTSIINTHYKENRTSGFWRGSAS